MNRREFSKRIALLGAGLPAGLAVSQAAERKESPEGWYEEPAKKLPVRKFDVVVAGGGTAGVVTAIAAARQGAKTMVIERKGTLGGTVAEGGTALEFRQSVPDFLDLRNDQDPVGSKCSCGIAVVKP
jgi:NADPH-dependent 2,4-dienoyl-CoA reductase/sulfur reductase-like enzyme